MCRADQEARSRRPVYIPPEQGIEDRRNGDAEQDAYQTHQPAADCDGGQYPNARQADGGAHHLGIDHIAFDLLEDHQEDQEGDRLERGDHQQQQSGKNRPDVGPRPRG